MIPIGFSAHSMYPRIFFRNSPTSETDVEKIDISNRRMSSGVELCLILRMSLLVHWSSTLKATLWEYRKDRVTADGNLDGNQKREGRRNNYKEDAD